jgi:hypothetical protein
VGEGREKKRQNPLLLSPLGREETEERGQTKRQNR